MIGAIGREDEENFGVLPQTVHFIEQLVEERFAARTLLQVTVEEAAEADMIMSVLMGDDVESRRNFITTNARDVRNLDF